MASGVRIGARMFQGLSTSLYCHSNTRRLSMDVSRHFWKFRVATARTMLCSRRLYASEEKETRTDVFSILVSDQPENGTGSTATTASTEGEQYDDGMQEMMRQYERHRQWLAHIMGKDPDNFGQKEIKKAIEYLMPSGLYARDARPFFMDPRKLFVNNTATLWDKKHRPLSAAFYTGRIGFHDLLYEIYEEAAKLDAVVSQESGEISSEEQGLGTSEDQWREIGEKEEMEMEMVKGQEKSGDDMQEMRKREETSNIAESEHLEILSEDKISNLASEKDMLETMIENKLTEGRKEELFEVIDGNKSKKIAEEAESNTTEEERADSPESSVEKSGLKKSSEVPMRWMSKLDFEKKIKDSLTDKEYEMILHRLKKLSTHKNAHLASDFLKRFVQSIQAQGMKAVKKQLNELREAYGMGHRKRAIAKVVVSKGTGNMTVNDIPLVQFFGRIPDRQQVMYPFLVVNAVGEYDVRCNVIGGGNTGQAGAIRLAISRALLNFEDSYQKPLQQAGLLIRDPRIAERKKPGQKKARKKFAWVRR